MLSDIGMARREAGLESLRGVVKRRGRRRVVVRGGGVVAAVLALVVGLVWARGGTGPGPVKVAGGTNQGGQISDLRSDRENGARVGERAGSAEAVGAGRIAGVGIIKTDPSVLSAVLGTDHGVVARLAPRGSAPVARLDDDGLQRVLRAAGEPAGIVRIGRRVTAEIELAQAGQAGM